MKTAFCFSLLFIFTSLGCSNKSSVDVDSIQSTLRTAMKAGLSKQAPSNIAGIWRSESTGSFLLIGKNHRAMILTVSDLGRVVHPGKSHELRFEGGRDFMGSQSFYWRDNVIERNQYDYREDFYKTVSSGVRSEPPNSIRSSTGPAF
ncbi:hypothetical protein [Prosthecobacter sp.]|uniref:hypothetical protein n=1 Tax=Prosthecobacter sp. TaxID=1965333 RepID=UPI0037840EA6